VDLLFCSHRVPVYPTFDYLICVFKYVCPDKPATFKGHYSEAFDEDFCCSLHPSWFVVVFRPNRLPSAENSSGRYGSLCPIPENIGDMTHRHIRRSEHLWLVHPFTPPDRTKIYYFFVLKG
jgi:hypothetical protein